MRLMEVPVERKSPCAKCSSAITASGIEQTVSDHADMLRAQGQQLADVEIRLGSVDTRLGSVDTRLDSVDTRLGSVVGKLDRVIDLLGGTGEPR